VLYADGLLGLVLLGLWLFCLFDVISTDPADCRNLPKLGWLVIVLILPDIGSLLWLVAGRPRRETRQGAAAPYPEYERPGRFTATNPDDDEEFLRKCRERAEEQRRTYRERQRAEQDNDDPPEA
jgi:hypothetical protein